jgi:hypothetical protein
MSQKLAFALTALALLAPTTACTVTANPIGGGGSTSSGAGSGKEPGTGGSGGGDQGGACSPACGEGAVCVESTCHALVKLDSGGANGCTIVVDDLNVYWSTTEVRIVPKSGSGVIAFGAWVGNPFALAADGAYVYFPAGNGGVARAKRDGKSGFQPFAGESSGLPQHMAWNGAMLFYSETSTEENVPAIYEAPTSGTGVDPTMPPMQFATDGYGIGTLAADATSVYYWGASGLVRQDRTTLAMTTLTSQGAPGNLNVDDTTVIVPDGADVYYSSAPVPGTGGLVAKVSASGGDSTVLVDGTVGASGVFAVDATSLYYMTTNAVMKMPKAGGPSVVLHQLTPPSPFATCMAVDDTHVYWVEGTTLMQYAK